MPDRNGLRATSPVPRDVFGTPVCNTCGHPRGDHRTGRTVFPHGVVFGVCTREGCECREYRDPAESRGAAA